MWNGKIGGAIVFNMFRNKRKNIIVLYITAEEKNEETKQKQQITEDIRISIRLACGSKMRVRNLETCIKKVEDFHSSVFIASLKD